MNLKERASKLKTDIPAVFFALQKPETPALAKLLAAAAVAYALSPVDLVPDFIPVLGYLDDILILPGLLALTIRLIPAAVMETCRAEAAQLWKTGSHKRWYYAIPILLIWVGVAAVVLRYVHFQ